MSCSSKRVKEIMGKIKWVWGFAYVLCTCLFLYQLVQILPGYFAPTMTHTEVKDVPLEDMDFPLDIKICFGPSAFNNTALKELGYRDELYYMLGVSKFNKFEFNSSTSYVIGWGGHNNHSDPVKNASEVLKAVKWNWNKTQLFYVFQVTTNIDEFWLTVNLQKINWVNKCYLIDTNMAENDNLRGMKRIGMYFHENILRSNNATVYLQLQGKNLGAARDIQDHVFYHMGDAMKLDGQYTSYRVKIKERVYVEGDPGRTCRNYPNSEFETYKACDEKYMKERVQKVAAGLNLMPPWMTDDMSKVTIEPVVATWKMLGRKIITQTKSSIILLQVLFKTFTLVVMYLNALYLATSFQQKPKSIRQTLIMLVLDLVSSKQWRYYDWI